MCTPPTKDIPTNKEEVENARESREIFSSFLLAFKD